MKVHESRKISSKNPVKDTSIRLKPLVRQFLDPRMQSTTSEGTEMPHKRKGMGLRVHLLPNTDISKDCSNKHVATNQSTTPHSIHIHTERSYLENKSKNTNLVTEEIAARFFQQSATSPVISPRFCDRLALTFGGADLESGAFFIAVDDLKVKDGNSPYLRTAKPKKSSYRMNCRIFSHDGKKLAVLQFQPKRAKLRFARLHFNPAAIGALGVSQVKQVLQMLFGEDFRELLGNGRITCLDSALDIEGGNVNDLLMYTAHPRSTTLYKRCFSQKGVEEWQLGSIYHGANKSGCRVRTYDKAVQLFECKGVISEGPKARVEVSYQPAMAGKQASVATVLTSSNPFADLKMAYYPSPVPADPMFEFFLYAAKEVGVNAALQKIADRNKRTAFRKALAKSSPDWWQPESYWSDVLAHIQSLDLFPKALFKKKLRLEPDE